MVTVEMATFPGLTYELEGTSTMSNFLPIPGTAFTANDTTSTMDVSLPPLRGFVRVVRTGP